ncbi:MAG: hypothetical protein Q9161_001310 [Pseudevernia consocians]
MAADSKTVNGNYGAQYPHSKAESFVPSQGLNASNGNTPVGVSGEDVATTTAPTSSEPTGAGEANKAPSKDEVGWYFVESYYTTLSKNPETLYLYYNKQSQFVSGVETQKVDVSVGQRAINDRIKQLEFQDCKVIGEISNKAAAHRKFVQTFVLAEQPKGYFVLNDIFRYILEDEEEEMEDGEVASEEAAPTLDPEPEPEHDAEQVDKKLEEEILKPNPDRDVPNDATPANPYTPSEVVEVAEDAPAAAVKGSDEDPAEILEQAANTASVTAEDESQAEKPRDPDPTPVASPPRSAKVAPVDSISSAAPAAPPKPAAPKTWANLVAANRVAPPAVPNGASSNNSSAIPLATQPKATPSSTNQSVTPPASANEDAPAKTQQNGNAGWQMAGSDNSKKQGRQHSQSVPGSQENVLGYVKNVTDKVDASILKTTLAQYGKLVYFDVSRPKNCAFVEFADAAAYNAAVAANPHSIGGEQIYVEERRPRANAYGGNFAGRGGMRGGRGGNEGRPGSSQGRGGFPKDGGRGGYVNRGGRGGNVPPRGRGQSQAA